MTDILSNPITVPFLAGVGVLLVKIAIDRAHNRKPPRMEFSLDCGKERKWKKLPASAAIEWSGEELKTFDQHDRFGQLIVPQANMPKAIARHRGMFHVRFLENGNAVEVSTDGTAADGRRPSGDGLYRIGVTRRLA